MNTQLILPLLLLPYWVMAAQSTDVKFSTNLAEAQARALRENKLYFIHFSATWCMPCQWMEENTFTNDTLAAFVQDYYIAVKIDFDDPKAATYKQQYKVTSLPSLLIFNAKGEVLDRFETSLSKDELLQALRKHVTLQPRAAGTSSAIAMPVTYTNTNSGKISRPALIPEEAKTLAKSNVKTLAPPVETTNAAQEKQAKSMAPSAQFAVQVGVFSDYANAQRTQTRMEQRFKQPVQLTKMTQNGKIFYKVLVGKFEEKEDADQFLASLSAQSVRGFVKNIDN